MWLLLGMQRLWLVLSCGVASLFLLSSIWEERLGRGAGTWIRGEEDVVVGVFLG